MFVELMPLLGERTVMITVARLNQNSVRVNVIPSRRERRRKRGPCNPSELTERLRSSLPMT